MKKHKLLLGLSLFCLPFTLISCNSGQGTQNNEKDKYNINVAYSEFYEVNCDKISAKPGETLRFTIDFIEENYYLDSMFFNDINVGTRLDKYSFEATMPKNDIEVTFAHRESPYPKNATIINGIGEVSGVLIDISAKMPVTIGNTYPIEFTPSSSTGETEYDVVFDDPSMVKVTNENDKIKITPLKEGYTIMKIIGKTHDTVLFQRPIRCELPFLKENIGRYLQLNSFTGIADSGYDRVTVDFIDETNGIFTHQRQPQKFKYTISEEQTTNKEFILTVSPETPLYLVGGEAAEIRYIYLTENGSTLAGYSAGDNYRFISHPSSYNIFEDITI